MEQVIKIVLVIIFSLAALAKLVGKSKEDFKKSGYGLPFMYATAVAEILFAIGLFSKYELSVAIGMVAILVGAIVTLILQRAKPARYAMAVLSLVLVSVLIVLIS